MEGFAPPRRVLRELCKQLPWCRVEGNIISANPPLDWEKILTGVNEWAMTAILMENGPVMAREDFEKMCLEHGMNFHSFHMMLTHSPIIAKYTTGVYGLRGAKVPLSVIESLKPKREPVKRLVDFGWTTEGKIWVALLLSHSITSTGIFHIPGAMKDFLQGNFLLKTADDTSFGNLTVKDYQGWSLSSLFKRRGGEVGDYLILAFDLSAREVTAYIGDEDLLDEFRPEAQ
jgi:hypothetical protein